MIEISEILEKCDALKKMRIELEKVISECFIKHNLSSATQDIKEQTNEKKLYKGTN